MVSREHGALPAGRGRKSGMVKGLQLKRLQIIARGAQVSRAARGHIVH